MSGAYTPETPVGRNVRRDAPEYPVEAIFHRIFKGAGEGVTVSSSPLTPTPTTSTTAPPSPQVAAGPPHRPGSRRTTGSLHSGRLWGFPTAGPLAMDAGTSPSSLLLVLT